MKLHYFRDVKTWLLSAQSFDVRNATYFWQQIGNLLKMNALLAMRRVQKEDKGKWERRGRGKMPRETVNHTLTHFSTGWRCITRELSLRMLFHPFPTTVYRHPNFFLCFFLNACQTLPPSGFFFITLCLIFFDNILCSFFNDATRKRENELVKSVRLEIV